MSRTCTRLEHRLQAVSLRHLRFVAALAQDINFSRAAERMAVSQPALSAAIRHTEELLALKLFDRTTHRVALTEAGRALLPHIQRLLVTAENAFADMADAAAHHRATVRIGSIPSAVPVVAAELAALEAADEEPFRTMLSDGKSDELVARLCSGALDIAICVHGQDDPSLEAVPLMEDEMVVLMRPDHRIASRTSVGWTDLADDEIIYFAGGSIGELVSTAMCQHGLKPSRRFKVDQVDSLYGIVRAGLAVGVMPRLYTMGLGWGDVVLIPLMRPNLTRRLTLLSRKGLCAEFPAGQRFFRTISDRLVTGLAP